jgi:hypothetical protein
MKLPLVFGSVSRELGPGSARTSEQRTGARGFLTALLRARGSGDRSAIPRPVPRSQQLGWAAADSTGGLPERPAIQAAEATPGPAVPPPGLIKIEPGKWYDPNTREIWTSTEAGWQNQGPAQEIPKTVKVAPGMEVPFALHLAARYWGVRTVPGAGFFLGGQFVRGKADTWRRQPTDEELAFGQMLMQAEGLDPRLRPQTANPREYFRDLNLYWQLVQEVGVPRTPQEAEAFWWQYQWREWHKKVSYAQAVGMDPSIYPPPDRWPEVLDTIGKPPAG